VNTYIRHFRNEYTYLRQLAVLLVIDTLLTIVDSYIPQFLSPIRTLLAVVQLVFMAATMAVTMRYVLEDY
jgi:hypothetical protein